MKRGGKNPMMRMLTCLISVRAVASFTMVPTYSILQNNKIIRNENGQKYYPYHCCHYRRPTDSAPDGVVPSLQAGASASVDIICSPPDDKNDYNFIVGNMAVLSADTLDFSRSLLVEGSAYATSLVCSTNSGSRNSIVGTRVKLSPGGLLCADITGVDKVEIFGKVVGDIQCKHLIVGKGGEIQGNVKVSDLTVGGGKITGSIQCDTQIPVSVFLRNNQNYVLNSQNRLHNNVAALMDAARTTDPKVNHRHDAAYHAFQKRMTQELNDAAELKKQKKSTILHGDAHPNRPTTPAVAPPSHLNDAASLINKAPAPTYTVPTYLNDVAALGLTMDSQYKRRVHGPRRIPVDCSKYNDVTLMKNGKRTAATATPAVVAAVAQPVLKPKPKPTLTRTTKPITSPPSYLNDAAILLMTPEEAQQQQTEQQMQREYEATKPLYSHTTAASTKLRNDFYDAAHGIDLSSYEKGHKGPPVDLSALNDVTSSRVSSKATTSTTIINNSSNGRVAPAPVSVQAPSTTSIGPSIPSNHQKNIVADPAVDLKLSTQKDIDIEAIDTEDILDPFAELDDLLSNDVKNDVPQTKTKKTVQAINSAVSLDKPTGPPIAAAAAHVVDALNNLAVQVGSPEEHETTTVPQNTSSSMDNKVVSKNETPSFNDVITMKTDNLVNASSMDPTSGEYHHHQNGSKHGVKLDRDKLYSEANHEELVDEFGTKLFVAPTAETVQSLNINRDLVLETQRLLGKNKSSAIASGKRSLPDWTKELGDIDGYDRPPGIPLTGTNGTSDREVHAFNESFSGGTTNDTKRMTMQSKGAQPARTSAARSLSLPVDPGERPYDEAKHGRKMCRDKMYSAANHEELVDEFGTKLFVAPSAETVHSLNRNRNLVLETQKLLQEKKEREAAAPARRDIFNMDKKGMSDTNLDDKYRRDRGSGNNDKGRFGKILNFFFK